MKITTEEREAVDIAQAKAPKRHIMTRDRSYYHDLVTLALPVAAQSAIAFLVTFADNLMVRSLGDTAVSGVFFASQINTLLQMFTGGIGGTILILSAQYWGRRETVSIRRIVAVGVHFSLAVGIIATLLCAAIPRQLMSVFTPDAAIQAEAAAYLRVVSASFIFFCVSQAMIFAMRSVEVTKIGMFASLTSLVCNIVLNSLFIYGLKWGVRGAAAATVISFVAQTVVVFIYVLSADERLAMTLRDFFVSDKLLRRDFIKYGLPLVAGEIVWSVNMMGNSIIFGRFFDETVSTAVSVANTMNTLAYITISGLASAVGIITGKTVGAGKTELMKEYARTTQVLFLGVGLFSGALVALLNAPFVRLYSLMPGGGISAEAAAQARMFIRVLSVTIIGTSYQMPCLFGLVKSGGDISFVFKNDTIFVFCVVLPSALVSALLGAPAWWVFACLKSDQILKCIVAVFKIRKYNWMKNLTRTAASEA